MGSEFLKKTGRTNAKSLDRGRIELSTPDLFTRTPNEQPRSVVAKLEGGAALKCGEKVIIEPSGNALNAVVGNRTLAVVKDAPPDVVSEITGSCGVARGEVSKVHTLSNTVELTLC